MNDLDKMARERLADNAEVDSRRRAIEAWNNRAAPPGWKLVPVGPTNVQLAAGQRAWLNDPLRRSTTLYRAMLAAAPEVK